MTTTKTFQSTRPSKGKGRPGRRRKEPVPLPLRWVPWATDGFGIDLRRHAALFLVLPPDAQESLARHGDALADRLASMSPMTAVMGYIDEPADWYERLERHIAVRFIEKLTHITEKPLPLPVGVHPDPNLRRRPLTPLEQGLVRICALTGTSARLLAVAAFDAGLDSGELTSCTPEAVKEDHTGRAATLDAPGARGVRARRAQLPEWCRPGLTARTEEIRGEALLLYRGEPDRGDNKIHSCILMNAKNTLRDAGLGDDPAVQPLSIRNGAARRIYETDGLEAAAAFIGSANYSGVAREIGLAPHPPVRVRRVQ